MVSVAIRVDRRERTDREHDPVERNELEVLALDRAAVEVVAVLADEYAGRKPGAQRPGGRLDAVGVLATVDGAGPAHPEPAEVGVADPRVDGEVAGALRRRVEPVAGDGQP